MAGSHAGDSPINEFDPKLFMNAVMSELNRRLESAFEQIYDRIDQVAIAPNIAGPSNHPPRRGSTSVSPNTRRRTVQNNHSEVEYDTEVEEHTVRPRRRENDAALKSIKFQIPQFYGKADPEAFLDWERKEELIFDCQQFSDNQKLKIVVMEFTDYAINWWDQICTTRRWNHEAPIESWTELKRQMRRRFVPSYYHRELHQRLQHLTQGPRTVEEYHRELELALMRANIEEDPEATMARFLAGLHKEIADVIELHHYLDLDEMVQRAVKVERQLKRRGKQTNHSTWNTHKNYPKRENHQPLQNHPDKVKPIAKPDTPKPKMINTPNTPNNPQNRARDILCFKCQGRGHFAAQCPNKRTLFINAGGEYVSESEESDNEGGHESEAEDEETDHNGLNLVTMRALSTLPKLEESTEQRENIFHCRCKVNERTCSMIIDGGSCTNVVSEFLVKRLNLATLPHPKPYKLQWLNNCGEVNVNKQVLLKFKVKNYEDELLCDVVPMQACHILLGRPWQYDKRAMHDGYTNQITFTSCDKKFVLKPLTPQQVLEDQTYMQNQFLEELKEKKKKKEENKEVQKIERLKNQKGKLCF